eukprot:7596006-Prorocentrum_lima.AAC.1
MSSAHAWVELIVARRRSIFVSIRSTGSRGLPPRSLGKTVSSISSSSVRWASLSQLHSCRRPMRK